ERLLVLYPCRILLDEACTVVKVAPAYRSSLRGNVEPEGSVTHGCEEVRGKVDALPRPGDGVLCVKRCEHGMPGLQRRLPADAPSFSAEGVRHRLFEKERSVVGTKRDELIAEAQQAVLR